jgi:hypothetical protein
MPHGVAEKMRQCPERFSQVPPSRGHRALLRLAPGALLGEVAEHGVGERWMRTELVQQAFDQRRVRPELIAPLVHRRGDARGTGTGAWRGHAGLVRIGVPTPAHIDFACRSASWIARAPAPVSRKCRRDRPPRTGSGSLAREARSPLSSRRWSVV